MPLQLRLLFVLWMLYFSISPSQSQTFNFRTPIKGFETGLTISIGAYKTYANGFINLQRRGTTPIFSPKDELPIYRWLLARLLMPRYLVLQATAYPLATTSSQLETFHPQEFNRFELLEMNLLRSIGTGPEEPYALSLLLGNFAFFGYKEKLNENQFRKKQSGSALAGFLFTTGHWHINDNIRIDDRWWQIELILTGNLKEPNKRNLDWNFRIGTKLNQNDFVPDVAIISLYRSHTAWRQVKFFSLVHNSRLQYEAHFHIGSEWRRSPFIVRQLFSYGKKIPFKLAGRFVALRVGGGVLWEWVRLYDHEHRFFELEETTQLIWLIQPSVEF